jgi:DNA-binding PadR family transcriptional regulator
MSLQGALAALLVSGPSHGYELATTLEAELGPAWSTRPSQVYLTIARMVRDGYVRSRRMPQPTRPDRQLLSLTDAGRRLANAWLWSASEADEIVVRLAVARLRVPERFEELAESVVRERTAELHRLRAARQALPNDEGFGQDALEREIRGTEADLRWVEHLRDSATAVTARARARRRAISSVARIA